jgi:hypothetical protein
MGRLRVFGDRVEKGDDSSRYFSLQALLPVLRSKDSSRAVSNDQVISGKEAVVSTSEVLIEGSVGNPGCSGDTGYR